MRAIPAKLSNSPWALVALLCLVAGGIIEAGDAETAGPATALTGGRVVTFDTAGTLESATILIRHGRIEAIGADVEIPEGAQVIDVSGKTVIPGLIDCRSSLWLDSGSVNATASDCSLNPLDAVDLYSTAWKEVARGGVTAVSVQPSGSLGGECAVLRVAPAGSIDDLVIRKQTAIQASIGLTGRTTTSRDRYAQYESLKKALDAAKKYREEWKKYNDAIEKQKKDKSDSSKDKDDAKKGDAEKDETADDDAKEKPSERGRPGGRRRGGVRPGEPKPDTQDEDGESDQKSDQDEDKEKDKEKDDEKKSEIPDKPKKDPGKELLVRVLKKELPLRVEAHRADDAANALALADEFDINVILEGCSDVGRSWSAIAEERVPLVAGPFTLLEATPGWFNRKSDRYTELSDTDNLLGIGTFSRVNRGSKLLRLQGAAAVAQGLTAERALRAITIDAARILNISDDTGTLRTGKFADLAVVAGEPLNPAAPIALTMSQGTITFQRSEDAELPSFVEVSDTSSESAELPQSLPDQYVLVSQNVLRPNGKPAPGAVVVRDGTITAIRKPDKASGGAVFDLGELVITPGLVAAHVTMSGSLSSEAVRGHLRAVDQFDPEDRRLMRLVEQGVTAAVLAPDSGGVVAGQCGVVRIASQDPLLTGADQDGAAAMKLVLSGASRDSQRFPSSLPGQLQVLESYFEGRDTASSIYVPVVVRNLIREENEKVRLGLRDRSISTVVEARTAGEADAALRWIESEKLQAALLGPTDLREIHHRLVAMKIGLIVDAATASDYDWKVTDVAAASQAGVAVAVSGSDANAIRNTIALLVAAGMNSEAGYRSLTSDAARLAGTESVGRLERNSVADIVIWDGDPLDPATQPLHVIVDGQTVREQQ